MEKIIEITDHKSISNSQNQEFLEEGHKDQHNLSEQYFEEDNQTQTYIVEAIRKDKTMGGQKFYLVKWQGYPEEASTWEPIDHLIEVPHLIIEYEERKKAQREKKVPIGITHVYEDKDGDLLFEVAFEKKTTGQRLESERWPRLRLREQYPEILLDFYQEKIKIDPLRRKKGSKHTDMITMEECANKINEFIQKFMEKNPKNIS